jgi:prepilin-type N-terminal cleavage/methylation domain-containing protein
VSDEHGFTLIEVMVAALVLVSGMLAVLTCITQAESATWSTQSRTNATAIIREVVEASRGVPYDQLVTPTLMSIVQTKAGLGDDQLGSPGWQIKTGNSVYTVSVGVCSVDDPRDGSGNHEAGQFCASGSTGTAASQCKSLLSVSGLIALPGAGVTADAVAGLGDCGLDVNLDGQVDGLVNTTATVCLGTCAAGGVDATPADVKRVVVLVRWDRGMGARYVLQGTTIANPGLAAAPAVTSISTSETLPVTSSGVIALPVTGTTSSIAATVAAYLDGTAVGNATKSGAAWNYTWSLGTVSAGSQPNNGEVVDGSYLVGLKAADAHGQFGQTRALTVILNRRVPYPPQGLRVGRNGSAVDLAWQENPERDVTLYRGYRWTGTSWTLVCETATTACRDTNPPALGTPGYTVVAVDKNPAGQAREGGYATTATVPLLNTRPNPPTNLVASSSAGNTVLTWSAPAIGDPDAGDSIDHYTIYRDGASYADRYDRTSDGTQTTWTDTQTGGEVHTYVVKAMDTHLAESTGLGPVTK